MRGLIGIQSHNKKGLELFLKGKSKKARKSLKIMSVPKPKWWYGNWQKTYEIRKK